MDTWKVPTDRWLVPEQVAQAKHWIDEADAVLIGIGSGMSAAAGLNYTSEEPVRYWYPEWYEKGMRSIYEIQYSLWNPSDIPLVSYWAFWARHIYHVRYELPGLPLYEQLMRLLGEKPTFFITTNLDGQLYKVGASPSQVYEAQGDYCLNRCSANCGAPLVYNEARIQYMVEALANGNDFAAALPRCPKCGAFEVPAFVAKTPERQAMACRYDTFQKTYRGPSLLYLELGVGFDTPLIIRFPFEKYSVADSARLLRMSYESDVFYRDDDENVLCIDCDVAKTIAACLDEIPSPPFYKLK